MAPQRYTYGLIAAEIAAASRYFDEVRDRSAPAPANPVLELIAAAHDVAAVPAKPAVAAMPADPAAPSAPARSAPPRIAYLLNGTLNYSDDLEQLLAQIGESMSRSDRVIAVLYNSYFRWLYQLAGAIGIRTAPLPTTFVTMRALRDIARLAGFELVRYRPCAYVPWRLLGLGSLINSILPTIPLVRHLSLAGVAMLRPAKPSAERPSLSIIIPARNEEGNIAAALDRLPDFGADVEVLFVEGHSTDDTWGAIERARGAYSGRARIRALHQTGRGKADAVRLGLEQSTGELVTILDADLTMPPELLPRFYEAYRRGLGDFINGNRLVYPMEQQAMRFLNRVGNIFFAKALSMVLDAPIGDSLCGTKLLARADWLRCKQWRADFGEFDPFGDFELLFPAAILGLGIQNLPVKYRERTYGSTNISRFTHGWMLLRMTVTGFFRVKLGRTS